MRDWNYRHHRKCRGGKCRTAIIGTKLQGWKMRDWNYRHHIAGGGKCRTGNIGTKLQGWKMRDQAVMESQNTCGTGIVSLTSSFFVCSYQAMGFWPTVLSVTLLVHCVVCLSSVCDVLYCGETVRPSEKLSEGMNKKPGSKSLFFGSPPYFYFRFRLYGYRGGRFCFIFARTAQRLVLDGTNGLSSSKSLRIVGQNWNRK